MQAPPGRIVLGAGSYITWDEYGKMWCEANGVEYGGYDEVPLQAFIGFMPPGVGRELGEMFAFMDEFGYDGSEPGVLSASDVSLVYLSGSNTDG